MRNKILLTALLFLAVFNIVGCKTRPEQIIQIKPPYDKPLPPGEHALRKILNTQEIPDFTMACLDINHLRPAIDKSLNYLKKPSSRRFFPCGDITHDRAVDSLEAFAELLDSGLKGPQLNQAISNTFDVYMSVGCDNIGTVLFTGYYTPIFDGSTARTERFKYPLYSQPTDLVKAPNGEILGRRAPDGQITQYPPRAVIETSGMLRGSELMWLSDPFEAYIAHVQGSAKIRMPDGRLTGVGYTAANGHDYKSISKVMVNEGIISRSQMSLSAMIDYFKKHLDQVAKYTRLNPRYVFFTEEQGPPRGSLNEQVTTMRTIATDKSIFPPGCIAFISTTLPRLQAGSVVNQVYDGFVLDQDTGGAIRAPGRCDLYMGTGQTAGRLAGRTYQEGRLYYLFLK